MLGSNLQTYQHSHWSLKWIRNSSCSRSKTSAAGAQRELILGYITLIYWQHWCVCVFQRLIVTDEKMNRQMCKKAH